MLEQCTAITHAEHVATVTRPTQLTSNYFCIIIPPAGLKTDSRWRGTHARLRSLCSSKTKAAPWARLLYRYVRLTACVRCSSWARAAWAHVVEWFRSSVRDTRWLRPRASCVCVGAGGLVRCQLAFWDRKEATKLSIRLEMEFQARIAFLVGQYGDQNGGTPALHNRSCVALCVRARARLVVWCCRVWARLG